MQSLRYEGSFLNSCLNKIYLLMYSFLLAIIEKKKKNKLTHIFVFRKQTGRQTPTDGWSIFCTKLLFLEQISFLRRGKLIYCHLQCGPETAKLHDCQSIDAKTPNAALTQLHENLPIFNKLDDSWQGKIKLAMKERKFIFCWSWVDAFTAVLSRHSWLRGCLKLLIFSSWSKTEWIIKSLEDS